MHPIRVIEDEPVVVVPAGSEAALERS